MACIVCSGDHVVLTSGSRLKVMPFSDPTHHAMHELKVAPSTADMKTGAGKPAAEKKNQDASAGVDPHAPTGRILAAAFSPTGKRFAVCTDQKELTMWATQPQWTKIWTRSVTKRCMALTFDTSESTLFVADKAGDVYQYKVEEEQGEAVLLLGHVSMLLDVVVSPDNKYILTGERDEKIRVSYLPNAYNIHTYCLGHTEFVSRLAILPEADLLVSAAGDSNLKLWDYRSGKELCKTLLDWARSPQESSEKNEATVTCISCSKRNGLVAVAILNHSSVPVYQVSQRDGQWSFNEVARIECRQPPWSLTFDPNGHLLILIPDEERPLRVFNVTSKMDKSFQVVEEEAIEGAISQLTQQVSSDWEFLRCSVGVQSVYRGLHKVPVDNMPDYLKRKQLRIESTKARRGRRRRNQKGKQGQKRSKVEGEDDDPRAKKSAHDGNNGAEVDEDDEEEDVDCVEGMEAEAVTS